MTDQPIIDPNSVKKTVNVEAAQEIAWRVFTEQMGTWWPLAVYKIGKANAIDAVVEPFPGGRWYERGKDGSTCVRERARPRRDVCGPTCATTAQRVTRLLRRYGMHTRPIVAVNTRSSI